MRRRIRTGSDSCCVSQAAGKVAREEGKLDLGSASDDNFHEGLLVPPPSAAELVSNAHSSRSASACVSPLADAEAGMLF